MRNKNDSIKTILIVSGIAIIILAPPVYIYCRTKDYIPAIAMATAIATATMAIINFFYLRGLKNSRLEALTREIKEVIYSRLYKELELFLIPESHAREDIETIALPITWSWTNIRNAQFHLAYQVPKRIFNKFEEFTKLFIEYEKRFKEELTEIRNKIILELRNILLGVDTELYRVEVYFLPHEKPRLPFKIFENLFLQKKYTRKRKAI
ncbi:MAG: hypothetical protein Q8O10_00845 [candidate division Zixibacteria bacterium]|nr:hypothetical protein [candidate division Zixibacteria bacterium]